MKNKDQSTYKLLNRLLIVFASSALLSSYSFIVTIFAYGGGEYTWVYLILYPLLLAAIILMIAKVNFGYLLNVMVAVCYSLLLTNSVGESFLYGDGNSILLLVIVLPYFLFLMMIPLSVCRLIFGANAFRSIVYVSILATLSIPLYLIVDRYDRDYTDSLFADVELKKDGTMLIKCKPGFADSRSFVVESDSQELYKAVKQHGESYKGSYFVMDLRLTKNFNFRNFRSLSIKQVNKYKLRSTLTWNKDELKGDSSFLFP